MTERAQMTPLTAFARAAGAEIDCFARFLRHMFGFDGRRRRRRPVSLSPCKSLFCGLSWGVGGAFLAHWLFG